MEAERTAIRVEMEQKREAEERRVQALDQAAALRSQMEGLRLREKEVHFDSMVLNHHLID